MLRGWAVSLAHLALFAAGSYVAVRWLLPVLFPFLLAAILAEVINPLVDALSSSRSRLRLPRAAATAIVLLVTLTIILGISTLAVARLIEEIRELADQLPAFSSDFSRRMIAELGAFSRRMPDEVQPLISSGLVELQGRLRDLLPALISGLQAFASLPLLITNAVIILIATYFLSKDRRAIGVFLLGLLPEQWHGQLRQVKGEVWASAMGFAKAQTFLITLTTAMTVVGLSWIGSRYAVSVGALVGVADLLPVLGPATVYLPWVLYHLVFGQPLFGVKLMVLYGLVAGVRTVLEPKLVGESVGLHPLTTLCSIYLGFQVFGAIGFIIGPLLAILLKALVKSGLLKPFPG